MQLTLNENEIQTIIVALEFDADDLEYRADSDHWATDEEKNEYRAAARKSRKTAKRVKKQLHAGNNAITG